MKNSKLTHPDVKSREGRALVILLTIHEFPQHRIAALFDVNQGRINEVLSDAGLAGA